MEGDFPRETGFTVPQNYFEDLSANIKSSIFADQLKAVSPNEGFGIPQGYFDQLQANIIQQTVDKPEPKILRLWHSNLLKYASAACFLIVAGAGIYFNQGQVASPVSAADLATEQMLFDIDEDVIIEHIEAHYTEPTPSTKSDAALESYILSNYSQNELTSEL